MRYFLIDAEGRVPFLDLERTPFSLKWHGLLSVAVIAAMLS